MRIVLGNRHAVEGRPDPDSDDGVKLVKMPRGKRATVVDFPEGLSVLDAALQTTSPQGVWANHATEGAVPAWVASDDETLAVLVSQHFGGIEIRELEENAE